MKRKVFAFLGDFYHEKSPLEAAVKKAFEKIEDVELTVSDNVADVLPKNPDLLVLGMENRVNPEDSEVFFWLMEELDHQLEDYVLNGGSLVVIHCGLASYPGDSKIRKMMKGEFISHPADHCDVRYFSENGRYDFSVKDEFYVVGVDVEETTVFLHSESVEYGRGLAGWYHMYGKGRVICVVPTHNAEGFAHDGVLNLYQDAFEWGLGGNEFGN